MQKIFIVILKEIMVELYVWQICPAARLYRDTIHVIDLCIRD